MAFKFCGEWEIRTPDTVSRIHTFQACSFNHSDNSPLKLQQIYDIVRDLKAAVKTPGNNTQ